MRMIDFNKKCSVNAISIYLTQDEADQLCYKLNKSLKDPEANEHFHIYENDMSREISCSIITEKKLKDLKRYNKLERKILYED